MNVTEASCKTNKISIATSDYTKTFVYSCVNTIIIQACNITLTRPQCLSSTQKYR